MSDVNLMMTTDHYVWAKEFVRMYGGDEELMATWFAAAMCAARDNGRIINGDHLQYMIDLEKKGSSKEGPA